MGNTSQKTPGHGLFADPSNLGNLGHQREVVGCRMKISQSVQLPAAESQMMRIDRQSRCKWIISWRRNPFRATTYRHHFQLRKLLSNSVLEAGKALWASSILVFPCLYVLLQTLLSVLSEIASWASWAVVEMWYGPDDFLVIQSHKNLISNIELP